MGFELRDQQMIISRNKQKEKPSQPDFRGTAMLDGVEHEVAMWTKENDRGRYLLGNIKRKGERPANPPQDEPF